MWGELASHKKLFNPTAQFSRPGIQCPVSCIFVLRMYVLVLCVYAFHLCMRGYGWCFAIFFFLSLHS